MEAGLRGGVLLLSLWVGGCSCNALVLDSSRGVPDGGNRASGSGGATVGDEDAGGAAGGADGGLDAGEDLIEPRSGTQIEVRGQFAGEAGAVTSVWDTVHGVACSSRKARDGKTRCLPEDGDARVWFTDPNCQDAVIVTRSDSAGCGPAVPTFAIENPPAKCPDQGDAVYEVGAPRAAPTGLYASSAFGCGPVTDATGLEQYRDAILLPSAEWVSFEHHVKKVTDRLGVGYLTGSDGSRLIEGAWLLDEDVRCAQEADGSGSKRCIPAYRVSDSGGAFSDATCETRVALTLLCDLPDLFVASDSSGVTDPCPTATLLGSLHRAVAVPASGVHTGGPGSCPITEYQGFRYYGAGDPVRFDGYPPIDRVFEGADRIQQIVWSSEGKRLYADGLYDSKLSGPCLPFLVGTGTKALCQTHDTPLIGGYLGSYFADAACTLPLYGPDATGPCAPLPSFVPVSDIVVGGCGVLAPAVPLRQIAGPHVGAVYSRDSVPVSNECVRVNLPPDAALYELGPAMDPVTVYVPLTSAKF